MMTVDEVLNELAGYGNEGTKKVFVKHGAKEPFFGVKVQDLKKIQKKVKKHHELSLALYATGNSDAMYLAGLIADEDKITKNELNDWVKKAYWYMISEYTVPWVASESKFGFELGLEWITSKKEGIAAAGWSTLASYASITPDEALDIDTYNSLLDDIEKNIHNAQNRVRYAMNGFVITVGSAVNSLNEKATNVAKTIGKVSVDMGGTACKVPLAEEYIKKIVDRGNLGKKRKTSRC